MFSGKIYTLALAVIAVFIALLISTYTMISFTEKRFSGTLQAVTQASVYDSRDDSARRKTAVFVINKDKFEQDVKNSQIQGFRDSNNQKATISFDYLTDTSSQATSLNLSAPYTAVKGIKVNIKSANNKTDTATYVISKSTTKKSDDLSQ